MTKPKTYTTASGRELTDDDLDAIAEEVEHAEYDVEKLKARRRGRPLLGSAPAEVVPVRLDPELKSAIDARAEAEHLSASEIIRKALRRYLDVA
jgi:Ribbon-helix-helix protein, copG family